MIAVVVHDGNKLWVQLYDDIGANGDYEPFNLDKYFDTMDEVREWIKRFRAKVLYLPINITD